VRRVRVTRALVRVIVIAVAGAGVLVASVVVAASW
jgi:hypothetical protein